MPHTQTPNDQTETLSDREFLEGMAGRIEQAILLAEIRYEDARKQLDHLDDMTHQVLQFIEEHRPALNRALAFMEPGKGIRDYLKNRPKAGSHD
jgi:hypothetical protein